MVSTWILFLASTCLAAGTNDFASLVSSVESELNDLNAQVEAWTAGHGLVGALRIQSAIQPLVSDVNSLKTAAQTVAPADITATQLQSLTKSIVAVLESLTAKEGDFTRTGAGPIVANDIRDLEKPTVDIITALINSLKQDCDKIEALSPLIPQISNAFTSAEKAYGGQAVQFPAPPSCQRRAIHEAQPVTQSFPTPISSQLVANQSLIPTRLNFTISRSEDTLSALTTSHGHRLSNGTAEPITTAKNVTKLDTGSNSSTHRDAAITNSVLSVNTTISDKNNTQYNSILSNRASSSGTVSVAGTIAAAIIIAGVLL